MKRVIYCSQAAFDMSPDELTGLLTVARRHNTEAKLSGMLLYCGQSFLQLLEGDSAALDPTYARILADDRHRNVRLLSDTETATRMFPDWTMGFSPLSDDSVKQLEGFNDFFRGHTGRERLKYADSESHQLLEWLAEYWFPRA